MIKSSIEPVDIDASKHLWDAFGNMETEISAGWIVRFCQQQNSWEPFSVEDLERFYHEKLGKVESFHFNRLVTGGGSAPATVEIKDGMVHVLPGFIYRCYESSPAGK